MKCPSFQESAALSILIHVVVFLAAIMLIRGSSHIPPLTPYTVRIVSIADIAKKERAQGGNNKSDEGKQEVKVTKEKNVKKKMLQARLYPGRSNR